MYVHRRTDTKDVFPGFHDFAAGGVLQIGEDPYDAAVREAQEELGVTGVALTGLGEGDYADDHTRYHAFCFTCVYDGPITWQPEEVAWGAWVSVAEPAGDGRGRALRARHDRAARRPPARGSLTVGVPQAPPRTAPSAGSGTGWRDRAADRRRARRR
ncbi:NUDIX domain-containing protein [Nocardioides convexus]|uniref:NUDIX domain-containing protein n=1 Tax=Nocardioides convexus TaxID=2712224 RepID=UPI0024183836|nr:NUDIX domain-containing protein [Nocardioides convexus]